MQEATAAREHVLCYRSADTSSFAQSHSRRALQFSMLMLTTIGQTTRAISHDLDQQCPPSVHIHHPAQPPHGPRRTDEAAFASHRNNQLVKRNDLLSFAFARGAASQTEYISRTLKSTCTSFRLAHSQLTLSDGELRTVCGLLEHSQ